MLASHFLSLFSFGPWLRTLVPVNKVPVGSWVHPVQQDETPLINPFMQAPRRRGRGGPLLTGGTGYLRVCPQDPFVRKVQKLWLVIQMRKPGHHSPPLTASWSSKNMFATKQGCVANDGFQSLSISNFSVRALARLLSRLLARKICSEGCKLRIGDLSLQTRGGWGGGLVFFLKHQSCVCYIS